MPLGYTRLRLSKPVGAAWGYHNTSLRLYVAVENHQLEGRVFPLARIRGYRQASNQSFGYLCLPQHQQGNHFVQR